MKPRHRQPLRQRKNLESLSQQEVKNLRDAFGQLKSSSQTKNYSFFAKVHFEHTANVHQSELFLPWHRAFIFEFEDALRAFCPNLTLPYWEWIEHPSIPAPFAANEPNPLYVTRYTDEFRRANHLDLPTWPDIDKIMTDKSFFSFGGGIDDAGDLECEHDIVHIWVGPSMREIASSPCDPIFWVHHANIDRLWAQWQSTHPGADPFNLSLPLEGLSPDWTVQRTLDINNLGYEYVESVQTLEVRARGFKKSNVLGEIFLPTSFRRAELRLEGLEAVTNDLNYIDVFIGNEKERVGRVSLYGASPMRKDTAELCFTPGGRMPPMRAMNARLDITSALKGLGKEGATQLRLEIRGGSKDGIVLKAQSVSIVFA